MKRLVLGLMLISTASFGEPRPLERPAPEEPTEVQPEAMSKEEFMTMVRAWNADPEFDGVNMAIRLGSYWALIDRSGVAAKAPAAEKSALDKVLDAVNRSNAAKASLHVEWKRSYFDENGKPVTESLIMDAGVAAGAAAAAQSAMDAATAKNHQ